MKILISVSHPAHVHLFRNPIAKLVEDGNSVRVVATKKELTIHLLDAYGIGYKVMGRSWSGLPIKSIAALHKELKLLSIAGEYEPDLIVSTGSPYCAHISRLMKIDSIAFSDTEVATLVLKSMLPFTSAVCTPSCFKLSLGPKHVRYNGYHELAYLHPKYFKPDPSVLNSIGLEKDERFIIARLASWDSSHDFGYRGFSFRTNRELLKYLQSLEKYGTVFLTSELPLSKDLKIYLLKLQPEKIHHILAYASLYIGEGATMASEAGVLGVPWLFVSTSRRGYLDDQEDNFGLGWTVDKAKKAMEKVAELDRLDVKEEWKQKREKLLSSKIDVTEFIVNFIENWPESFEKYKGAG